MNEGKKTGIFWLVAGAMVAIATVVAWPTASAPLNTPAGNLLFEKFTDPLAAANLKIVTFNEEQGQLATFEVRKDRDTDVWTIPSRNGYPADALDHMKNAANAFVGLKILDIQTSNAEDHDDLGVAEPKLEDLEVGDDGVGRMVIFKDDSQDTLASLIIGDALKDDEGKRYVRIPGQDPVYVVKLDETSLTTNFQAWIEDDLLQLSSIDIADMEIKDYSASLNLGGQISLTRNYAATVSLDGSDWKLEKLAEYDPKNPLADPTLADVPEGQKLNKAKLDAMKNALDDLKIADVVRKPDGMSANLRANQDLLADKDAVSSLAQRGFYPVPSGPQGQIEILSANGELTVSLKDGVKYVMRFGNIAGVTSESDTQSDEEGAGDREGGVNRYLLVTAMVDESKFPAPDVKPVPKTLEELEAMLNPPAEAAPVGEVRTNNAGDPATPDPASATKKDGGGPAKESVDSKADTEEKPEEPAKNAPEEPAKETDTDDPKADDPKAEEPSEETAASGGEAKSAQGEESTQGEEPADESEPSGETDANGSGEASGTGQAQQEADTTEADTTEADTTEADTTEADSSADKGTPADEELTEEEKLERLEAEQEKITKENQRKVDERKDRLEAAQRKVSELNARFADWYYVIPESTYADLRIRRDELFESATEAPPEAQSPLNGAPQFNFPGIPGN